MDSITANLAQDSITAEEEFILFEHSGDIEDLPLRIKEELTIAEGENIDQGMWIVLADGCIEHCTHMYPFEITTE